MIDPSAPFGELIEDNCEDNPQSDVHFHSLLSDRSATQCELEVEMRKEQENDIASPKFGVKSFDFSAPPEKPRAATPKTLCKKESLSTIEERSFDVS